MPSAPHVPALRDIDEVAELRARVRALRLCFRELPGVLVGLYELDGTCILMEGVKPEQVTASEGRHFDAFVPGERRERFLWLFERARFGETTKSDYPTGDAILEAITKPVRDERGEIRFVLFYCRDITAERAAATATAAKGGRDSLTGLPKRSVLAIHVAGLLRKGDPFALLFVDLDNFKGVNDTLGHKTGDLVLERVAKELHSTRAGDLAVRLGGDEFVVVLADATSVMVVARRIRDGLLRVTEPFGAGASMGVALYPDHGATLDELLAAADRAMYRAKASGDVERA